MWKAFDEMKQLGWLNDESMPKMISVQTEVCAPIAKAWDEGTKHAEEWTKPSATIACGIRVPKAIGDFLILDACKESGGFAMTVSEAEIESARVSCGQGSGLLLCPEGAATLAAAKKAIDEGRIDPGTDILLFNCGNGLKYEMPDESILLDRHAETDWSQIE